MSYNIRFFQDLYNTSKMFLKFKEDRDKELFNNGTNGKFKIADLKTSLKIIYFQICIVK